MCVSIKTSELETKLNLLHEPVALAATLFFLLQLYKLKLAERFEDVLEVIFVDGEVDVADVETVEWDAVGLRGGAFGGASLTVFLCLGELCDDGDAEKLLSCQSDSFLH